MDPFVVVAFSKKVFRTRVVRNSLNPVFDEKLFFQVGDLPGGVKPVIQFRYVFLPFNYTFTSPHSSCSSRAQYHPYNALRRRFWRYCLAQCDTDNTGTLSRVELTAMLDSLGSTLSRRTLSTFFTRFRTAEISIGQAVEEKLSRPEESRTSDLDEVAEASRAELVVMVVGDHGEELKLDLDQSLGAMHFSGPPHVVLNGAVVHETQPMQMSLEHAAEDLA